MPASNRPDLRLEGFDRFGGTHWESAALAHALAWEGVTAPRSRRPLSEAMCFGIAGGIAAGYALAPAGRGAGGAVSVIGRHRALSTGPEFIEGALRRLGARPTVRETGGPRAAEVHLERALGSGHPAFVWCAPPRMFGATWAGTFGGYVLLVHGIDRTRRLALISDRARGPLAMPLAELARLRGRVRAHRRRLLTFTAPARLGRAALRRAIVRGIRAGAGDMLRPRLRTRNLPGLAEWSRLIANPASRGGWPRLFRGGRLFLALRDVYDAVETAGTGGGLYRPLYAEFLKEAARETGKSKLLALARTYVTLGQRWTELARTALPDHVAALRQARALLVRRARLIERGGAALPARMDETMAALGRVERRTRRSFPLDHVETMALLTEMSERIDELHAAEARAARALLAAVQ
jgi:hypothetical protein